MRSRTSHLAALLIATALGAGLAPGVGAVGSGTDAVPLDPSTPALPVPGGDPTHDGPASTQVRIATFNVLGASHTGGRGGYSSGVQRTKHVVKLLQKHHVQVVGFQEMQTSQMRTFQRRTDGAYATYPGLHGRRDIDSENSIGWKKDTWTAVEKKMFTIPYFGGNRRAMPLVKLRNRQTGLTAWFANVHNPATNAARRGNDGWRRKAILREAKLARQLHKTGLPVFLTGDMNEREKAFCPLTGKAPLHAARGGSHRDGRCHADNPRYVDWIFGSRQVGFTGYVEDRGGLDRRTSDHPVVVGTAHLDPSDYSGTHCRARTSTSGAGARASSSGRAPPARR
jgi:hypothetical protein